MLDSKKQARSENRACFNVNNFLISLKTLDIWKIVGGCYISYPFSTDVHFLV